jgi:hypothetical protein
MLPVLEARNGGGRIVGHFAFITVISSPAKSGRGNPEILLRKMDCFVTSFLAMTATK